MAPPQPYVPADMFPNLSGATVAGVPTILMEEAGDEYLWFEMNRNDYTIATASDTTPIKLTFTQSIAGMIVTGNSLFVQGVSGSSTVNGFWFSVTIVDAMSLTLDGSVAGGAGTGGQAYEATLGLLSKLIDACYYLGRRLIQEQTPAYSTTVAIDWADGISVVVGTLTGNVTVTSANEVPGQVMSVVFTQDGTGSRSVTWPATFNFGAFASQPSVTAGDSTMFTFKFNRAANTMVCIGANVYS